MVQRPLAIDIAYTDRFADEHSATLRDLEARCFLHELDHINGILYLDRLHCLRDTTAQTDYDMTPHLLNDARVSTESRRALYYESQYADAVAELDRRQRYYGMPRAMDTIARLNAQTLPKLPRL